MSATFPESEEKFILKRDFYLDEQDDNRYNGDIYNCLKEKGFIKKGRVFIPEGTIMISNYGGDNWYLPEFDKYLHYYDLSGNYYIKSFVESRISSNRLKRNRRFESKKNEAIYALEEDNKIKDWDDIINWLFADFHEFGNVKNVDFLTNEHGVVLETDEGQEYEVVIRGPRQVY